MEPNPNKVTNLPVNPATPPPIFNLENIPNKSHKMLFLILGIFIVIALVGGIAGSYFLRKNGPISNIVHAPTPSTSPNPTSGWNNYNHPLGFYRFQYPKDLKIKYNNPEIFVTFPNIDSSNNNAFFTVEKGNNDIYNRPFDKYVREYSVEINNGTKSIINGLPAIRIKNKFGENTERIFIKNGNEIYIISFYNYGSINQNAKIFEHILTTFKFQSPKIINSEIKVIDGDIFVSENGNDKKITNWGYNSSPVFSPDKSKIAYVSRSEESIENEKIDQRYVRSSTNVWISNKDGSNPIQITKHIDFVYRSELHWLDNDRLMFMDGEETANVYNLSTKSTSRIFGPEKQVPACMDACGYSMYNTYSPDYNYFVNMLLGYGNSKLNIVNTKSLTTSKIKNPYSACVNSNTIKFSRDNKSIILTSNTDNNTCDGKNIEVIINLENQQLSTK